MILGQRDTTIYLDAQILGIFNSLRGTGTTALLILMLKYHNPLVPLVAIYKNFCIKGL